MVRDGQFFSNTMLLGSLDQATIESFGIFTIRGHLRSLEVKC